MNGFAFLRNAMRDRGIGAVTRSSRMTIARVIGALPSPCARIVEYGAGDGVITEALLAHLASGATLYGIERNPAFLRDLGRIRDPRFRLCAGDVRSEMAALFAQTGGGFDAIVSSLPLAMFTPDERASVVQVARDALRPGGRFIVCQYTPLILPLLRAHFHHVRIRTAFWNFPPYLVMVATR